MDIANILSNIADKLNNSDCGVCWRFVMGGRQDYLNLANDCGDDCCAILGVLRVQGTAGYQTAGEFSERRYTDWRLQLFAGIPSRLDIQFYDELNDYTEGSKWGKYIQPISCCIDGIDDRICDIHNCQGADTTIEVRSFEREMKLNFLDNNYDGWTINITLREWRS